MKKFGGVSKYGHFELREAPPSKEHQVSAMGTKLVVKDGKVRPPLGNQRKSSVLSGLPLNGQINVGFEIYQDLAEQEQLLANNYDSKDNAVPGSITKQRSLRRSFSDSDFENRKPEPASDETSYTRFSDGCVDHNDSHMSVCNNSASDTVFSMDHSSVKLSLSPGTENILCAVNPSWAVVKSAKSTKKFDQSVGSVESMDTKSVISSQLSMKSAVSRMDDKFISVEMRSVTSVSEYLTARTSSTRGPRVSDRFRQATDEAFSKDIYAYLRKRETIGRPRPDYMTRQHNVTRDMRAVLIDWFCDVIAEYNQSRATFFLAVNLVDRTLSAVNCPSDKLQLLGATAIFVAGKYEEVSPANIRDMAFVTEDTYDVKHIEWMERNLLNYVSFDLSVPTVEWFASYFSHLLGVSSKAKNLMWYLLELSALEYDLVATRPSVLAASALALAIGTTSLAEGWPDSMRELSGITIEEITPMIATLRELHERAAESRLNAIPIKYSDEQYHKVAQLHVPQSVVLRRD